MAMKSQSVLCGSIGFTTHGNAKNNKINEGYAMIQGNNLQILHNGTQITFNLNELLSSNEQSLDSANPDLKHKYTHGLSLVFAHELKKTNEVEWSVVGIYTNNVSLYQSFNERFTDIVTTKIAQITTQNQNTEETTEEDKEDHTDYYPSLQRGEKEELRLALQLYKLPCAVCDEKYDAEQLFFCAHEHCETGQKVMCAECGLFTHKKKSHHFYTNKSYIICVGDLMKPDDDQFKSGFRTGKLLKRGIKHVKHVLLRQRWITGTASSVCGMGGATGLSALINGAPTVIAACGEGGSVIGSAIGVSALGGGICAAIGIAIEGAYIGRQLYKGRISKEEAKTLGITAVISNGLSVGTYFGCMAAGAALGTPGGPVGWIIGAVVAALVCGVGSRILVNKACEAYFKNKQEERSALQKEALGFFFGDKTIDINDRNEFNEKIVRRRYRRLAIIHHPDTKDGDHGEWLKLSAFYGILTAIIEEQEHEDQMVERAISTLESGASSTISNDDDDDSEVKNDNDNDDDDDYEKLDFSKSVVDVVQNL